MWASLEVVNFQSLKDVRLQLGKLTVIVGPSSSGKSALVRALRVLVQNGRGSGYVRHGSSSAAVGVQREDGVAVSIQRGALNEYRLASPGADGRPDVQVFTKLGGAVPAEITAVLGVPSDDRAQLHFAGQFDRPYLLDETGSTVARVLGELTNVHVIFEAAREANRRARAAGTLLKTRQLDLERLQERAQEFRGLRGRLEAVAEAERLAAEAERLEHRRAELVRSMDGLEIAETALVRAEEAAKVEIPDVNSAEMAYSKLQDFVLLMNELRVARQAELGASAAVQDLDDQIGILHQEQHAVLAEAGVCPTCGQNTKELVSA